MARSSTFNVAAVPVPVGTTGGGKSLRRREITIAPYTARGNETRAAHFSSGKYGNIVAALEHTFSRDSCGYNISRSTAGDLCHVKRVLQAV